MPSSKEEWIKALTSFNEAKLVKRHQAQLRLVSSPEGYSELFSVAGMKSGFPAKPQAQERPTVDEFKEVQRSNFSGPELSGFRVEGLRKTELNKFNERMQSLKQATRVDAYRNKIEQKVYGKDRILSLNPEDTVKNAENNFSYEDVKEVEIYKSQSDRNSFNPKPFLPVKLVPKQIAYSSVDAFENCSQTSGEILAEKSKSQLKSPKNSLKIPKARIGSGNSECPILIKRGPNGHIKVQVDFVKLDKARIEGFDSRKLDLPQPIFSKTKARSGTDSELKDLCSFPAFKPEKSLIPENPEIVESVNARSDGFPEDNMEQQLTSSRGSLRDEKRAKEVKRKNYLTERAKSRQGRAREISKDSLEVLAEFKLDRKAPVATGFGKLCTSNENGGSESKPADSLGTSEETKTGEELQSFQRDLSFDFQDTDATLPSFCHTNKDRFFKGYQMKEAENYEKKNFVDHNLYARQKLDADERNLVSKANIEQEVNISSTEHTSLFGHRELITDNEEDLNNTLMNNSSYASSYVKEKQTETNENEENGQRSRGTQVKNSVKKSKSSLNSVPLMKSFSRREFSKSPSKPMRKDEEKKTVVHVFGTYVTPNIAATLRYPPINKKSLPDIFTPRNGSPSKADASKKSKTPEQLSDNKFAPASRRNYEIQKTKPVGVLKESEEAKTKPVLSASTSSKFSLSKNLDSTNSPESVHLRYFVKEERQPARIYSKLVSKKNSSESEDSIAPTSDEFWSKYKTRSSVDEVSVLILQSHDEFNENAVNSSETNEIEKMKKNSNTTDDFQRKTGHSSRENDLPEKETQNFNEKLITRNYSDSKNKENAVPKGKAGNSDATNKQNSQKSDSKILSKRQNLEVKTPVVATKAKTQDHNYKTAEKTGNLKSNENSSNVKQSFEQFESRRESSVIRLHSRKDETVDLEDIENDSSDGECFTETVLREKPKQYQPNQLKKIEHFAPKSVQPKPSHDECKFTKQPVAVLNHQYFSNKSKEQLKAKPDKNQSLKDKNGAPRKVSLGRSEGSSSINKPKKISDEGITPKNDEAIGDNKLPQLTEKKAQKETENEIRVERTNQMSQKLQSSSENHSRELGSFSLKSCARAIDDEKSRPKILTKDKPKVDSSVNDDLSDIENASESSDKVYLKKAEMSASMETDNGGLNRKGEASRPVSGQKRKKSELNENIEKSKRVRSLVHDPNQKPWRHAMAPIRTSSSENLRDENMRRENEKVGVKQLSKTLKRSKSEVISEKRENSEFNQLDEENSVDDTQSELDTSQLSEEKKKGQWSTIFKFIFQRKSDKRADGEFNGQMGFSNRGEMEKIDEENVEERAHDQEEASIDQKPEESSVSSNKQQIPETKTKTTNVKPNKDPSDKMSAETSTNEQKIKISKPRKTSSNSKESKEERPNAEKRERKIGQSEPATQTALEAPETCASSADSSEPTANKQPNKKSKPKKSEVKVDPPIDEEPEPVHPNMMKLEEEPAKVRDKKKSLWNKVKSAFFGQDVQDDSGDEEEDILDASPDKNNNLISKQLRINVIHAVQPSNVSEERVRFFNSDFTYEPQFTYAHPCPPEVLDKYSEPCTKYIEIGEKILTHLLKSYGSYDNFDQQSLGEQMSRYEILSYVDTYCSREGIRPHDIMINISTDLLSTASMGKMNNYGVLSLKLGNIYTGTIEGVLRHELGTHYMRRFNNNLQPWKNDLDRAKFRMSPMNPTEEGLASIHSVIMRPQPMLFKIALLYYTVVMASMMSFSELFKWLGSFIKNPHRRWEFCMRAKRGQQDTSKPGCFVKDQVYLTGAISILKHRKAIDFKALIQLGKVAFEDVNRLKKLANKDQVFIVPSFMHDKEEYMKRLEYVMLKNGLKDSDFQLIKEADPNSAHEKERTRYDM